MYTKLISTVILITIATFSLGACTDKGSPEYAAKDVLAAIGEGDALRAESYLDLDRISKDFVAQATAEVLEKDNSPLAALGASMMQGAAEKQIRGSIQEGLTYFAREENLDERADFFKEVRVSKVNQQGNIAEVEYIITTDGIKNGTPTHIRTRMEKSDDQWRVVQIMNLDEFVGP